MSSIAWCTSLAEGETWFEPEVDGVLLSRLVTRFEKASGFDRPGGYSGLAPGLDSYGDLDRHLLGSQPLADETKVALLGCGCGSWRCWPLLARVTLGRRWVLWDELENPHRPERDYSELGPFRFRRDEYEAAVAAITSVARNANLE